MSSPNDIINAGILKTSDPPRDSWKFGTCADDPAVEWVDVLIDGDTTATTMRYACPVADGDRVVVMLLGRSWVVMGNLDNWIPA